MDVNFSNVLEGTRQYFQGLPKDSPKDESSSQPQQQHEGSAPSPLRPYWAPGPPPPAGEGALAQSGCPAMAESRPPSEAAVGGERPPSEPLLEPEPHIIHKATVMQQAQQARQAFLNSSPGLERPSSANLISPPSHIIRKPQRAPDSPAPAPPQATPVEEPRIPSHFSVSEGGEAPPLVPSPARDKFVPHIPAQPQPSQHSGPHYSSRPQGSSQRTLTVLEPRRASLVQPYTTRVYPELAPLHVADDQNVNRKVSCSVPSQQLETYNHRRYESLESYPPQEARHNLPSSNHYLKNPHKSQLPVQPMPQQSSRVAQPQYPRSSGYYPPQNNVDHRQMTDRDKSTHHLPVRSYTQLVQPQKARALPVSKAMNIHQAEVSQQVRQQAYNQKVATHQTPSSYSRSHEYYASQMNNHKSTMAQESSSRAAKVISSQEYNYTTSRVPHNKAVNNHLASASTANYQERVTPVSIDHQRHPSLTSQHSVNSSRTQHSLHSSVTKTSLSGDSPNHYSRVPSVHPHHHSSRLPEDYPPLKSHLPNSQSYTPDGQQYHVPNSSNHTSAPGSTSSAAAGGYLMQSYQSSSAVKATYDMSPKHTPSSSRNAAKPALLVHQPRMTVSVTSLVNQMNMRQHVRPESTTSTVHKNKKESPLDLSVKTVRIPADSTAKDEMENVSMSYDKRVELLHHNNISNLNNVRNLHPPNSIANHRQRFSTKPNNVNSHKVDFLPNFNAAPNTNTAGEKASAQYREPNQSYLASRLPPSHYDPAYSKPHHSTVYPLPKGRPKIEPQGYGNRYEQVPPKPSYGSQGYSRRIDPSLPKIDLTINLDDHEKDHRRHPQTVPSKEDTRKRDDSHIPNHVIPPKIARYESWNHDRHAQTNMAYHKETVSASNHYNIPNGTNLPNPIQRTHYENHTYKKSENIEPHSSKYHMSHSQPMHPHQEYYQHNHKAASVNHHNYDYSLSEKTVAAKQDTIPLNPASFHNQNTTPADKRVLSILRNSLEAKNSESQKLNDDDCIVIPSDDSPPQSVDNTEYQSKKSKHYNEHNNRSALALHLQPIISNNIPYKVHVPRAVDSIRYDSDTSQKSLRIRDDLQSNCAVPIMAEPPANISPSDPSIPAELDIAARIRTKAELKGFIQPVPNSDNTPTIAETKSAERPSNTDGDSVPHRRRLFSKTEKDNSGPVTNENGESKKDSTVRNSSDSCVFDFQDSGSESEVAPMEKPAPKASLKETFTESLTKIREEPLVQVKSEKLSDEDSFWTDACDSFLEELQTGKVKKAKRRKHTSSMVDEPALAGKEILESSIKIEKPVIVNVIDNIKTEQLTNPLLVKIKEEVNECTEVKPVSDSSDEDLPLINKKVKKEQMANNMIEKSKNIDWKSPVIKLEANNDISKRFFNQNANSQNRENKSEDRAPSSDDEQLIVKKRKQERAKEMLPSDSSTDSSSDSEELIKLKRLRKRKSLSISSKSADGMKSMKTPTKEEIKLKEKEDSLQVKKPGFGDGSDFRPGWEEEVYKYKRSLRMPATLIQVSRPPHWPRVSTSLPDLDPCPNSPAPSTSTEELYTHKKYAINIFQGRDKCKQDLDSDSESMSSSLYAIKHSNYDSEASCSTVISTASKRNLKKQEISSITDTLIQKYGKKDIKKKKIKEERNAKLIPKSTNPLELMATPSLGLENVNSNTKKGNKHIPKEKVMEELFYLGSFRKKTVSTFRDAFINNTDGLLGATEEFSPMVLKSRTRTETRVLKHRATMKEVFGDERPASAPPVACTKEEITEEAMEPMEDVKPVVEGNKIKVITAKKIKKSIVCSTLREGLRSSRLKRCDAKGRLLRMKKRDNFLKSLASKKNKISASSGSKIIKKEPISPPHIEGIATGLPKEGEIPVLPIKKKRFKRLFNRRKLSSGFDYIRKKKKLIKKGDPPKIRRRNFIPRPSPESVQDIQKEIKNWIIKKSVGETVLHRAARLGYIDCVAYCLEKMDIPPSCRDNAGYTPLHEACSRGHMDIARLLLQYGADVSEAAQGGIRPLHEACENGYLEIIRLLLSYGADPLLATYSGQTPVSLSTGKAARLLQLHLNDVQGNVPQPWLFQGPCKLMDPIESGFDPLASPPTSPPTPPPVPLEMIAAHAPLPPLYRLRPHSPATSTETPDTGLWCLLQDLASLLQVKSRDALLKQIHCGAGPPRDSLKELRMQEFLDRAQCQQLMAAGEKINIRASKIALVRYTEKVKQLLNMETVTVR